MITFDDGELDSLDDFEKGTMHMAAAMAAGKETAHFRVVYFDDCSPEENTWTEEQHEWAMNNAVVETTVSLVDMEKHSGGYYCIKIGSGWFGWGAGDPLASAFMTYYEQDGLDHDLYGKLKV